MSVLEAETDHIPIGLIFLYLALRDIVRALQ